MLNEVAGELSRMLLSTGAKLAATVPRAAQIEVPDTDMKESLLPIQCAVSERNQVLWALTKLICKVF